MGQLNIKDEALIANARRLADELGTNVTGAVRVAVDAMLAERDQAREARRKAKFEAIMTIAERASKLFPVGTTSDHSDFYDENGLPK